MTTNQDQLVKNIQAAVAASPELQKQLATAQSSEQAADLLSAALGSPVSAAELQSLSNHVQSQMTDEQLEAVAAGAGDRTDWILISIMSVGIGCAVGSIVVASVPDSGGCKSLFEKNP